MILSDSQEKTANKNIPNDRKISRAITLLSEIDETLKTITV
jgi:hypothetical protein